MPTTPHALAGALVEAEGLYHQRLAARAQFKTPPPEYDVPKPLTMPERLKQRRARDRREKVHRGR